MPLVKNEAQNKFPERANYSALPAPNTVPGQTFAVLNEQGTSWLPGSIGGTYYDRGLYYSSGVDWIYTNHPFNASQATVDAGLNNNQFLTPLTFTNSAQLAAKQNSLLGTGIVRSVAGVISYIDGPATSFVKADGSLDTNTYLTGNQNITLTGDVTGSGTTAIVTTLATVNVDVGSFGSATQVPVFTVNGKGLITAVANTTITPSAASITGGQALTKTDDTNVTLTLGGTPGSALLQAASLTLGWTGQLSVARGGTGLSAVASGSIIAANTADTFTAITSVAGNKGLINDSGVISWATVTGTGAPVRETSPALLGVPTAPTAANGTNTAQIATTSFVINSRPVAEWYSDGSAVSPVDGSVYYFGGINNGTMAVSSNFRILSPKNNAIFHISWVDIIATVLGSAEGGTIDLLNLTQATSETLTTTHPATRRLSDSHLVSTLANNAGDEMTVRKTNPAWGTNPTGMSTQVTVKAY